MLTMSSMDQMQSMQMFDCMQDSRNCPIPAEHMSQFFSVHPATLLDQLAFFLVLVVLSVAWFLVFKNFVAENERLRLKLRNSMKHLAHAFTPNFLVFAFSKGILHSKIYA